MHYGYAASLGITRSANRKNRWLRAPATNFTRHASAIARDPITRSPPRASMAAS